MLIAQLLETSGEVEDLHFIAKYITRFINLKNPKGTFKIAHICNLLHEPFDIYSDSVRSMLDELKFNFSSIDGNILGGFYRNEFGIQLDIAKIKKHKRYNLELVISHELQHALDFSKSPKSFTNNAIFSKTKWDDYLRWKEEINARFTEVLLVIAQQSPPRKNFQIAIDRIFNERKIFRELYDKGPKGQRKYNQLKKRAYKFYDEFVQINSRQPKATVIAKIKNLILRFSLFK